MNAEALRDRIVRHAGKRQLNVNLPDWSLEGCKLAIAGFSAQIRDASDPVLHETLVCDFSTTTPEIRTASEVSTVFRCSGHLRKRKRHDEAVTLTGTIQLRRNSVNVLYRCPQCPDILQGTGISNEKWKELLDSGLPITVKGL
jgi:hypothetical protein